MLANLHTIKPYGGISFCRHYINVDMGASRKNVSCKLQVQNEQGNIIAEKETTVFEGEEDRDPARFEGNVAKIISDFDEAHKGEIIKKTEQGKPYEPVVTVCCPGPAVIGRDENGNKYEGNTLSNIEDKAGKSFSRPINGKNIVRLLGDSGLAVREYMQINDTDATGACVLEMLKNKRPDLLEEGKVILHLYPGGGLGSGVIEVSKDRYILKTFERGSIFEQGIGTPPISKKDRSSVGLLENFCEEMGLDAKSFKGDAKVVTDYEYFNKMTGGLYKQDQHKKASLSAMEKLMNALASVSALQLCDAKTDTIVIAGPAAGGVRETINDLIKNGDLKEKYPEAKCFEDVMKSKIEDITKDIRKKLTDFDLKILFLDIKNNTQYAHKFHESVVVGTPASWYEFPKQKTANRLSVVG